mmetsp:Transcript_43256/g.124877  ORF Transcript_43256/g.124877 Transcript_43256/m.124877 type:complete len:699 (+) Transcript_43256:288-2384(+)
MLEHARTLHAAVVDQAAVDRAFVRQGKAVLAAQHSVATRKHLRRARGAEHNVARLRAAKRRAAVPQVHQRRLAQAVSVVGAPRVPLEVRHAAAGPRLPLWPHRLRQLERLRGEDRPVQAVRCLGLGSRPLRLRPRVLLPRLLSLLGHWPLWRLKVPRLCYRADRRARGLVEPLQQTRLHSLIQCPVDVHGYGSPQLLEVSEGPGVATRLHDLPAHRLACVPPGGDHPAPGGALRDAGRAHEAHRAGGDLLLLRLQVLQSSLVLRHLLVEAFLVLALHLLRKLLPPPLGLLRDVPGLRLRAQGPLDLLPLRPQEHAVRTASRPLQLPLPLRRLQAPALLRATLLGHATACNEVSHGTVVFSLHLRNSRLVRGLLLRGHGLPALPARLGHGVDLRGSDLRGDRLAALRVPQEEGSRRPLRLLLLRLLDRGLLRPRPLPPLLRLLRLPPLLRLGAGSGGLLPFSSGPSLRGTPCRGWNVHRDTVTISQAQSAGSHCGIQFLIHLRSREPQPLVGGQLPELCIRRQQPLQRLVAAHAEDLGVVHTIGTAHKQEDERGWGLLGRGGHRGLLLGRRSRYIGLFNGVLHGRGPRLVFDRLLGLGRLFRCRRRGCLGHLLRHRCRHLPHSRGGLELRPLRLLQRWLSRLLSWWLSHGRLPCRWGGQELRLLRLRQRLGRGCLDRLLRRWQRSHLPSRRRGQRLRAP